MSFLKILFYFFDLVKIRKICNYLIEKEVKKKTKFHYGKKRERKGQNTFPFLNNTFLQKIRKVSKKCLTNFSRKIEKLTGSGYNPIKIELILEDASFRIR